MIETYSVQHLEYVSKKSFEEVVEAFEAEVGDAEHGEVPDAVATASDEAEFRTHVAAFEGSSGFMRFLVNDHGAWLSKVGEPARARLYTIGNPLVAETMITHDPGVGLNVPISVLVYATRSGETRLAYDLPSSLMSRLENDEVTGIDPVSWTP